MADTISTQEIAHLISALCGLSVEQVLAASPLSLIIDSLTMLQVLAEIEKRYSVTIDETKISPGDFRSIDTLTHLLHQLRQG